MSDHPLNEYKEFFHQLKIKSYKNFITSDDQEALVAGTIMSIQEKKSIKGTPFAIVKFSDNTSEYELFLFSEMLIKNREILRESGSFVMTLQKDRVTAENAQRRINIRKILDLNEIVNRPYEKVSIELAENYNLEELQETLKEEGSTEVKLIIKENNKSLSFKLEKPRKFDFGIFNDVKNKQYVKKISF
jgi:DNA polymerase-3 subunit alpha